jgi:hypothetical protein
LSRIFVPNWHTFLGVEIPAVRGAVDDCELVEGLNFSIRPIDRSEKIRCNVFAAASTYVTGKEKEGLAPLLVNVFVGLVQVIHSA